MLEFHFDFGSPNAFLSHRVIPDVEENTGEKFIYVPVLLGGVFKATGNVSPMVSMAGIENKLAYQALESHRFIKRHKIDDFQANPSFPVNTLQIMRGATYALTQDYFQLYMDAVFNAMWTQAKKMDDPDIITDVLERANLPVTEIMAGIQMPETKQKLIENTERSVVMGTFGSPTFFIGKDIYFGKDKLAELEIQLLNG